MHGTGQPAVAMLVWFLAFSPVTVRGQVDHRINRGNALGTGHALDQNPGLTARGMNYQGSRFDFGNRADAITTGNITGLSRLHISSPVLSRNQFRQVLPSSELSGYLSRSVGVAGIQSNRVPLPTYYYGLQETVADVGYIRSGLNAPGSSQLISPYTAPLDLTKPFSPVQTPDLPKLAGVRGRLEFDPDALGVFHLEVPANVEQDLLGTSNTPFEPALASSIFGAPPPLVSLPTYESQLPRWMKQSSPSQDLLSTEDTLSGVVATVDSEDPDINTGRTSQSYQVDLVPSSQQPLGTQQPAVGAGRTSASVASSTSVPPDLGQDIFTDLYRAVEAAERSGIEDLGFQPSGTLGATGLPELPPQVGSSRDVSARSSIVLLRRSRGGLADLAAAARWAGKLLEDPITSFVGRHESRFAKHLATAENALRAGEYYNAARFYELAHLVNRRDPLPLLGRGHALIAAGDYVSAFRAIESGIARFPQIAAFRLDLPALARRQDAFDVRRADLENRLAAGEHHELRFLLGYLELYSGLPEEGLRNLGRAAELAPPGSIVAIFPDLVLGRRPLPTLGADRRRHLRPDEWQVWQAGIMPAQPKKSSKSEFFA